MTATASIDEQIVIEFGESDECNLKTAGVSRGFAHFGSVDVEEIPLSFFEALADIRDGRIVDMEQALDEPPPSGI